MKKRVLALLLVFVFALTCFTACGGNTSEISNDADGGEGGTPAVDYSKNYVSVLDEYHVLIANAERLDFIDDRVGVIETAKALGEDALSGIGYLFKDINADGVDELLIGQSSADGYVKNDLFAVYTLIDGAPVFVTEGRSRNSYSLMENGELFNMGSNGASYSIFGTYALTEGAKLACTDFYFTYDKSSYDDIGFFHNTTGVYEKSAAEELDMDSTAFFAISEGFGKKTIELDFMPFAEYTPSPDAPEAPVPIVPAFVGEWKGTSRGYDGTNYALFVNLYEDGTAIYKCGPVQSEIMVDCHGTWSADDAGETIALALVDRIEGFSFNGQYKWSVNSGLELTHVGGDAFLYGAEGRTFGFGK